VILALGGQPTNTPAEVLFRMNTIGIGQTTTVTYLRDGELREAVVALAPAPDSPPRDLRTLAEDVALRGLTVGRITPAVIGEMNLAADAEGVIVMAAEDRASRAGLESGDILLAINGQPIVTTEDVEVAAAQPVRLWQVDILRQGQPLRMRFRL
jgi:S1-C subfamily serine protease